MAVTVTDNRTNPTNGEADSTTGWSSPSGNSLAVYTAQPDPVESTGSLGMAVSSETSNIVLDVSGTTPDLTNTLIYIWTLANGTMDNTVNGGVQLVLGDGTNLIGYHLAGSDVAAFRHEEGPVGWQCLMLDTASLPADFTTFSGSEANLTLTAITQVGAAYKTLSKALGGTENCFTDIVRYGNGGLNITGETSSDPGTFLKIATEDRNTADLKAFGVIRELGAGLYGVQGPLSFGDNSGTTATYFADTNATVVFEDRGVATDKYSITVQGNATGSTTFQLGNKVGTTTGGSDGCSLVCPSGVGASLTASDPDLQSLLLYGSSFIGFNNGITFSSDGTNGPNHEIFDCAFSANGQIDIGLTSFKNNSISTSTDSTGSVLISDTTNVSDLGFTSGGTGHAILITSTGTYDFTNFTYSGFGADDTTDAVVYNNSGGSVTINVVGGDTPTVRNGSGASTTVNNNISLTVTIKNQDGDNIPGVEVAIFQDDASRTVVLASTPTDENGQVSTSVEAGIGGIIIRARQSTNIATFDTNTGVDGSTEVITTDANHNFQDGDPVVYKKDGGTESVGLTEGTTYYVNNITATTLSLHTTAADAISDTSRVDLTAGSTSETHQLDPVRYFPASATGTVGSSDFSAQITMVADTIATG